MAVALNPGFEVFIALTVWFTHAILGKVKDEFGGKEVLIGAAVAPASPHGFTTDIVTPNALL